MHNKKKSIQIFTILILHLRPHSLKHQLVFQFDSNQKLKLHFKYLHCKYLPKEDMELVFVIMHIGDLTSAYD